MAGPGALPRGVRPPAGRHDRVRPTTTCCCSSTRTCLTLGTERRRRGHVLVDPAAVGAEPWSGSTGAATSPTTGPGQLVGYPDRDRRPRSPPRYRPRAREVEQVVIDTLVALGLPRRPSAGCQAIPGCGSASTTAPDGSPGPRKICAIGVRTLGAGPCTVRPQRRPRPGHVRPHRPLRDRRQAGDLARRRGRARSPCATSWSTRPRRGRGCRGVPPRTCSGSTDPAASRRPPGRTGADPPPVAPVAVRARRPVERLDVRLRQAGVDPGAGLPVARAQAPVAAGPGPHGRASSSASSTTCATSTWSRCARRPAAPTSSSAGPTARPPS